MTTVESLFSLPVLPGVGPQDFARAAALLKRRAGIVLGEHKRDMVERTLATRAAAVACDTVQDYLQRLARTPDDPEWQPFVNAFTINHTAFFREEHHFGILSAFVQKRAKPVAIWSAACSTGEEAYSIAIRLLETVQHPGQMTLLATDIDTEAIAVARAGIYPLERVKPVPDALLKKYFQRGRGSQAGMARVRPNVRDLVQFDALNLLDPQWPSARHYDAIFCRNTLIYFDKATQTRLLERFARVLKPGGLLFAGHSENLTYLTPSFRLLGQTVYERVCPPGTAVRPDAG